jgi:hypothetical protein
MLRTLHNVVFPDADEIGESPPSTGLFHRSEDPELLSWDVGAERGGEPPDGGSEEDAFVEERVGGGGEEDADGVGTEDGRSGGRREDGARVLACRGREISEK